MPCASTGAWDGGEPYQRTFVYDASKHLLSAETRDSSGAVISTIVNTWDGDHIITQARTTTTLDTRTTFTWVDDRLATADRQDLLLDDGDDGYTITNTYRAGVQLTQRLEHHDPTRGGTLTTITGDDTTRATWRECAEPADGSPCAVYVYEQPDRDPDNWTRATDDFDDDGVIEDEYLRTLDGHALDLTFEWASFIDGARLVAERDTLFREGDGTLLSRKLELFDAGAPTNTYVETYSFGCAAARVATTSAGGTPRPAPERPWIAARRGLDLDR
ncbi:MAG: hypothetical protein IPL61_01090 [Myxococcales bacterium]|nr:hypothetical protein [Myxococcales bacterium]